MNPKHYELWGLVFFMVDYSEQLKAQAEMTKSVRDLLTLKVKLPLGNPNLRLLHTNQYITLDMPSEFELANMEVISEALNSGDNRYSSYSANRWYIEGITITNNGGDASMDLDLNPFASSIAQFRENYMAYQQAYKDAYNSDDDDSSSNGKGKGKSNSGSEESELAGGEGKTIDKLVKEICTKKNGKLETKVYNKAKRIHEWLVKNRHYTYYLNSRTSSPAGALKRMKGKGINCADTSRLTASMFRSAGVECYVIHIPKRRKWGHYFTVFEADGKLHCSDATGNRKIDEYVTDVKRSNHFTGKKVWDKKCGKNPCS